MPDRFNSNPGHDREKPTYDTPSPSHSTHVPVKGYPGEPAEGTTVKNPKAPETSKGAKVEDVANKAAHKAAKQEQESKKRNGIFSK